MVHHEYGVDEGHGLDASHSVKGLTAAEIAAPLPEVGAGNGRARGEYGQWDSPFTCRQVFRPLGYDVITVQALVLDPFIAQKLAQPLCSRDCTALPA